ncbi:hypothetical protein Ancab_036598 [Ancistrocladus abbreviatus]
MSSSIAPVMSYFTISAPVCGSMYALPTTQGESIELCVSKVLRSGVGRQATRRSKKE